MIGQAWRTSPYRSQRETPAQKMTSMPIETSPADLDVQVFCSWGQKAQVVNVPAANPNKSIPVIPYHPFLASAPLAASQPSNLLVKTDGPVVHFPFAIFYRFDQMKECTVAFTCDLCSKRRQSGNNISHANNKTKRIFKPNLQPVRALIDGQPKRIRVCTRCLRSGKVEKAV